MSGYRDLLDELFVTKLGYEFRGTSLQSPAIEGLQNLISLSREYSANGVDVILAECNDRIIEFQKQLIRRCKNQFPDSHFLFVSHQGHVFDLYNVSSSKNLKKITYNEVDGNTRLFKEKLEFFDVETANGTLDFKSQIDQAFDCNDEITNNFYEGFKKIHEKLAEAIRGEELGKDNAWYASVLMNRLMFIYFLQKHRAIQDDYNFLLNKYEEVQKRGKEYYRDFLLPLFFYGFAKRDDNPEKQKFVKEYGYIKYLNGGLFYPHHLEKKCTPPPVSKNGYHAFDDPRWIIKKIKIEVDSRILKEALEFLNKKTAWYTDSRPLRNENEINADALGYIFEMGVNEREKKQYGTYYTKEDITKYISQNTIIPFILDKLRRHEFDAPDPNPMITNNDDIIAKTLDYIEQLQEYEALKFLYKDVLTPLSVLDPAVGSGAFLFAALKILLQVYRKVIFKLKSFRDKKRDDTWLQNLCITPDNNSEDYFLTKQIILNNLYGVDIVEEATEICKLRLFLQLASYLPNMKEIEPLPDLDFNIYTGNSLVGGLCWEDLENNYTWDLFSAPHRETIKKDVSKLTQYKLEYKSKIDERVRELTELKQQYRQAQQRTVQENELNQLRSKLESLTKGINCKLNIGSNNPFHWFIEFKQIMERGGFDVIIGNPPYVVYNKKTKNGTRVCDEYEVKGYRLRYTNNLYTFMVERSTSLGHKNTRLGMIIPLSAFANQNMQDFQVFIKEFSNLHIASFHQRPAQLFEGVLQRLCIFLLSNSKAPNNGIYTTKVYRWYSDERKQLFDRLRFIQIDQSRQSHILKVGNPIEKFILDKFLRHKTINNYLNPNQKSSSNSISYRTAGGGYWWTFLNSSFDTDSLSNKTASFANLYNSKVFCAILNSDIFWWWYCINFDLFNLKDYMIFSFHFDYPEPKIEKKLISLSERLEQDLLNNARRYTIISRTRGANETINYQNKKAKPIIEEIDFLLFKHYGLTVEEGDFIINYDREFRMRDDE